MQEQKMAILQIKDSNGNWREIAALKGDTGPRGETPEIDLKATTLPAGSAATVTKSGTVEHPVFTLGIPKGETPTDVVKTVNNQAPDASGNVNVTVTKESVTTALGYTPLSTAGGTVTNTLSFSTPIVINQTANDSHTTIRGGVFDSDGARLVLTSKGDSDGGQFKLYAHDGTNNPHLVGDPAGYLQWNDENIVRSVNGIKASSDGNVTISEQDIASILGYIPLSSSGGTVTDTLSFSTPVVINQTTDTSYTTIRGGTSNSDGARLVLTGKGDSDEGQFKLYAHNGTNSPYLVGDPTGYLQWNDENIVRSVNGVKAGNDGDVTITAVQSATEATKATQDGNGNVISNTYVKKTDKVTSASSADSAIKATQDASGNVITSTYATKSELNAIDVGVTSVNGQTGAITGLATLASPTFTGTPKAPTAAAGTNSTQIATTAFVKTAVDSKTSVSGNAGTATKLATPRTISLTGDATGSASFDGSGDVTLDVTVSGGGSEDCLKGDKITAVMPISAGDIVVYGAYVRDFITGDALEGYMPLKDCHLFYLSRPILGATSDIASGETSDAVSQFGKFSIANIFGSPLTVGQPVFVRCSAGEQCITPNGFSLMFEAYGELYPEIIENLTYEATDLLVQQALSTYPEAEMLIDGLNDYVLLGTASSESEVVLSPSHLVFLDSQFNGSIYTYSEAAQYDGIGKEISTTYATKSEVSSTYTTKNEVSSKYATKSEVSSKYATKEELKNVGGGEDCLKGNKITAALPISEGDIVAFGHHMVDLESEPIVGYMPLGQCHLVDLTHPLLGATADIAQGKTSEEVCQSGKFPVASIQNISLKVGEPVFLRCIIDVDCATVNGFKKIFDICSQEHPELINGGTYDGNDALTQWCIDEYDQFEQEFFGLANAYVLLGHAISNSEIMLCPSHPVYLDEHGRFDLYPGNCQKITYGTTDVIAGTSYLRTGDVYLVYE